MRRWVKSELLGKQESTDQEHCRVSYIMIWFHFVICMNTCMLQCDSSIPVIFYVPGLACVWLLLHKFRGCVYTLTYAYVVAYTSMRPDRIHYFDAYG